MNLQFWVPIILLLGFVILWPLFLFGISITYKLDKDIEDIWPLFKKQNCPRCLKDGAIYFPSRRSLVFTVLPLIVFLPPLVLTLSTPRIVDSVFIIVILLFILWTNSTTGYIINNTQLLIRVAIFKSKIE